MAFGALCAHTGMTSSGWELGTTLICDVTLGILASHTQCLHQSRHHHCVPWHHHRPWSVTWKWALVMTQDDGDYDDDADIDVEDGIMISIIEWHWASLHIFIIELLTSSPWSSSSSSWPSSPSLTSSWSPTLVRALTSWHLTPTNRFLADALLDDKPIYGPVRQ